MELNKDNLYNEYIVKKQTVEDVSKIFNVSIDVIYIKIEKKYLSSLKRNMIKRW